ncbi:hypothetical protein ACCS79_34190 [Rhizobium johnstonii]|uniref:hypothetical protein n=1 Tax=Rhizobium johnstonii TaxID=3019933 RepID=UPI003F9CDF15
MAKTALDAIVDKGGLMRNTDIQGELHGLPPDVCHDILATIRHERQCQSTARIVLIVAMLLLVSCVFLFLTSRRC